MKKANDMKSTNDMGNTSDINIFAIRDNTMAPTLQYGDVVITWQADEALSSGIYEIIDVNGGTQIVRCQLLANGYIRLLKDKGGHIADVLPQDLKIASRVMWVCKSITGTHNDACRAIRRRVFNVGE